MTPTLSFAVQVGIVMIPAIIFIAAKRRILGVRARLALGLILAVAAGSLAFHLASEHGWRPIAKSGKTVDLQPSTLFLINTGSLLLVVIVLTFAKKKPA
jgi:hypothetical protein